MFSLSVAMDKNKGIGYKNSLPWHISEELKLFKANTLNKNIVMGRKTFESLPGKLNNRIIHVITNDLDYIIEEGYVINDINAFINEYINSDTEYVICGGSSIYSIFYPYCKKIYLSIVDGQYNTDKSFDKFEFNDFEIIEKVKYEQFTYYQLERK